MPPLRRLLIDPWVLLYAGVIVVTCGYYALPEGADGPWVEALDLVVPTAPLWVTIGALLVGLRRLETQVERRFWLLLALAHVSYLLAQLPYPPPRTDSEQDLRILLVDVAILGYYAAILLAAATNPHLRQLSRESWQRSLLAGTGSLLFLFGLLTYFVLVPAALDPASTDWWIPTVFLFALLDAVACGTFAWLARSAASPRWRRLFGLVALNQGIWAALDLLEALVFARLAPAPAPGGVVELLWLATVVPLVLAARSRGPVPEVHVAGRMVPRRYQRILGAPLVAYVALLPVVHLALHASGTLGPQSRPVRDGIVVALTLLLGALAILDQRLQQAEIRRVEQGFQHAQRLDSLGRLAGGIAHGFNNALTVILGNAQLARAKASTDGDLDRRLGAVQIAGERARDLVKQVLAFSREGTPERTRFRLQETVAESLDLVRATPVDGVDLRARLAAPDAWVLADRVLLQQGVLNLVSNALQALRGSAGVVAVTLELAAASDDPVAAEVARGAPACLRLDVADSGAGMAPEVLERAFDPFFTTKPPGEGTGLGLAVVYGVVSDAGGVVTIDSAPAQGTTVHVYLPIAATPARQPAAEPQAPASSGRV